jgi:hypothetical protein
MKFKSLLSSLMTIFIVGSAASAADRVETVRFKRGATSTTLTGSVRGYDGIKYLLGASAGQAMSALFKSGNTACYMNITSPRSNAAMFIGSTSGNEYAGNLPASGNYAIQIYLMRSAARRNETCKYSLTVEVSGAARAAVRPSTDALVPGTNFSATGVLPCSRAASQPTANCKFGVVRSGNGSAQVTVFWPDGGSRIILFEKGTPASFDQSQADGDARMSVNRNGDLFMITIGAQRFEIVDAIVSGG